MALVAHVADQWDKAFFVVCFTCVMNLESNVCLHFMIPGASLERKCNLMELVNTRLGEDLM